MATQRISTAKVPDETADSANLRSLLSTTRPTTLPSVLDPTLIHIPEISYDEATAIIKGQTGPGVNELQRLPPRRVSIVLYSPLGSALTVSEGLLLQCNVSIVYLVTWLQVFLTDFCMTNKSQEPLIVRAVEIRVGTKEFTKGFPGIKGELIGAADKDIAAEGVKWNCGSTGMEAYWQSFRDMLQLGGTSHIEKPILKVKTIRWAMGAKNQSLTGDGHKFDLGNLTFREQRDDGLAQVADTAPETVTEEGQSSIPSEVTAASTGSEGNTHRKDGAEPLLASAQQISTGTGTSRGAGTLIPYVPSGDSNDNPQTIGQHGNRDIPREASELPMDVDFYLEVAPLEAVTVSDKLEEGKEDKSHASTKTQSQQEDSIDRILDDLDVLPDIDPSEAEWRARRAREEEAAIGFELEDDEIFFPAFRTELNGETKLSSPGQQVLRRTYRLGNRQRQNIQGDLPYPAVDDIYGLSFFSPIAGSIMFESPSQTHDTRPTSAVGVQSFDFDPSANFGIHLPFNGNLAIRPHRTYSRHLQFPKQMRTTRTVNQNLYNWPYYPAAGISNLSNSNFNGNGSQT